MRQMTGWPWWLPGIFSGIRVPIVIAVLIMVSTFGCNNGLILAGARVYYAMANDQLFFKKTGQLNKKAVPANGVVVTMYCCLPVMPERQAMAICWT